MKEYLLKRQNQAKHAKACGIILTAALHIVAALFVCLRGTSYIWPPSEDTSFLIDFTQEMDRPSVRYGRRPVSPMADKTKPEEIVRKSESPVAQPIKNETRESAPDPFGDVETPAPEPKTPELDARASFPGMGKKPSDATTPHSSTDPRSIFKEGQSDGNAKAGPAEGNANAHLSGREVLGYLQKPAYNKQESGVVVIRIWVTPDGVVKKAVMDPQKSTIQDATLVQNAVNTAYKTKFSQVRNLDENTPPLQEGTITYIFKLK